MTSQSRIGAVIAVLLGLGAFGALVISKAMRSPEPAPAGQIGAAQPAPAQQPAQAAQPPAPPAVTASPGNAPAAARSDNIAGAPATAPASSASPQAQAALPGPPLSQPATPAASPSPAPVPAPEAPSAPPAAPAFDVVRVEPTGEAVIAGRALPGATVELMRNGSRHDRVVADASGLFVLTPPPLPPGEHELTLRFSTPDGLQVVSRQNVIVSISPTRSERPMIVITAPDQPSVILSMPERASPAAPASSDVAPAAPSGAIAIVTVEAEGGRLYVSGRGAPSAAVRLYLNESYLASGNADREGRLDFIIERGLPPGDYRVRLDAVDVATGTVRTRAEVTFVMPANALLAAPAPTARQAATPPAAAPASAPAIPSGPSSAPSIAPAPEPSTGLAAPAVSSPQTSTQVASSGPALPSGPAAGMSPAGSPVVVVPDVRTATVSRGDSLWRISRRLYGQG